MKLDNNIYIYKNNFISLINLIILLIKNKIKPLNIKDNFYNPSLLDNLIKLKIEEENINDLINFIGNKNFKIIYNVYLSNRENKELIIYYYLLNAIKYREKTIYLRKLKCVSESLKIYNYVKRESHKFKGFTRFKELKNKVLYAEINPENNIILFLSIHFKERLKNEYWVIKDVNRNILSLYNKKEFVIVSEEDTKLLDIEVNEKEQEICMLWKEFYKTIGIEQRKNDRCRMNFMPKKYWQYIVEVSDEKNSM